MANVKKRLISVEPRILVVSFGPIGTASNGYAIRVLNSVNILREKAIVNSIEFISDIHETAVPSIGRRSYAGKNHLTQALFIILGSMKSMKDIRQSEVVVIEGSFFLPFAIISKVMKKKVIFDSHGMVASIAKKQRLGIGSYFERGVIGALLDKLSSIFSDMTFITTNEEKSFAHTQLNIALDKLFVIPNALDRAHIEKTSNIELFSLRKQLGISPLDVMALFVGDLRSVQNRSTVEFIEGHLEYVPTNVKIVIVGKGREDYHAPHGRITYVGYVKNVSAYYEAADVFIAPMITGTGIKTKIIEAMAHGIPVIATDVAMEGIHSDECRAIITTTPSTFFVALQRFSENHRGGTKDADMILLYEKYYSFDALKCQLLPAVDRLLQHR